MKSFKVPAFVFLGLGVLFLVGGGFWLKSKIAFSNRAQTIVGEISKQIEDTCTRETGSGSNKRKTTYACYQPVVKYNWQGQTKEAGMSERTSSGYDIGKKVDLLVDPSEPAQPEFKGASLWFGPLFLLGFGAIFALVGGLILRSIIKRGDLVKTLNASGVVVTGQVTYCGLDQTLTVNGRHPWKVEASWVCPTNGQIYVAKTVEEIWHDPSQMGQVDSSGQIQVKYNPTNPEQSMVVLGTAKVSVRAA